MKLLVLFILSLPAICIICPAVACYGIKELHSHGKLRWMDYDASFWGDLSYYRKYTTILQPPLDNWYYKLFKIGYKERWPTSATFTVFLTDGWHFCQFLFIILFSLSAVTYQNQFGMFWDFWVYWGAWRIVFWVVYNGFQKSKK